MINVPPLGEIRSYQCPVLVDDVGIESQSKLTQTELQIVVLLCYGMTREEIGALLNKSPITVRNQITGICGKLGLYSSPQIVAWYINNLLLDHFDLGLEEIWRL